MARSKKVGRRSAQSLRARRSPRNKLGQFKKSTTRSKSSAARTRSKSAASKASRARKASLRARRSPRNKLGQFKKSPVARRPARRSRVSRKKSRTASRTRSVKSCSAGRFQSPKTHNCVTCKAFKTKELHQFSRLLGLNTRGKDRMEMCGAIRSVIQPAHFGEAINKLQARHSRKLRARRSAAEKLARGEALFGGYRRPARKSLEEWASLSGSPFVGTAPTVPSAPLAPKAAPAKSVWEALGFASEEESASPALSGPAPAPPAFSFGAPAFVPKGEEEEDEDVEYVEMDEEEDYDEPYVTKKKPAAPAARGKKDWRDMIRAGYFSDTKAASPFSIPSAPAAPAFQRRPEAEEVAGETRNLEAIQDFIRAYANRKDFTTEAGRAAAMTRDLRETFNVTTDYEAWKNAPWDYDWQGVDTEGSDEDFMDNMRKGGFLRGLSEKESKEYL